ncbi:MAG: nuclear transport factor 2 family protein [Proteobacteria bacterium]|nr:nuclear transport factor 2 family protein [Pseudomonadota bacterium]
MGKATEMLRAAYAGFMTGNIPAIVELLGDDVEWTYMAKHGVPYGGTYRGKQEVLGFFKKLSEAAQIVEFEPKEFFEGPSHCACVGRTKGRALPDGAVEDTDWIHIAVMNDAGKISRWYGTEDTAARWKK